MPRITLNQLQKRTKHQLLSDEEAFCMSQTYGPITVRDAERKMEARYPLHRRLRRASIRHFLDTGWDVMPYGVGVWGVKKAMADLAIAKGKRIILVECLTPGWVYRWNVARKKRLQKFFPLWFVIEDPAIGSDTSYKQRVERLALKSRVYTWFKGKSLALLSTGRAKTARR